MITEFAHAKVNLALTILGRRADGYHLLDSVVAFAACGDVLTFAASDKTSLSVDGPFAHQVPVDDSNIILKAERLLRNSVAVPPAAIRLTKNLPVASGIGGGSSDAAATLRGLLRLADTDLPAADLTAIALKLGADVPVCLGQRAARMSGIGEKVVAFSETLPAAIVLANPLRPQATQAVFAALGLAAGQQHRAALDLTDRSQWTNDLAKPSIKLLPEISDVLAALTGAACFSHVSMSGSGATCFGLVDDVSKAHDAAAAMRRKHPGWWIAAGTLA